MYLPREKMLIDASKSYTFSHKGEVYRFSAKFRKYIKVIRKKDNFEILSREYPYWYATKNFGEIIDQIKDEIDELTEK